MIFDYGIMKKDVVC